MEAIHIRIRITFTSFLSSLLRLLLILSYLILSYFILPPSYPLFCASFLSYLILSHLLLILSTAPAEEPLGHQHQQEERSHRTNLGV